MNGQSSSWCRIRSGVPQGSVLGPLLFLVFINDIPTVVNHCEIRLFADDTCLFIILDDREQAADHLKLDLDQISHWANRWLVNFNADKTKEMIISKKL